MVVTGAESSDANTWQMFYDDESVDAPVPWWFNSVTGESTWECPTELMATVSPTGDPVREGEYNTECVGNEVAVVRSGVDQEWTQLWSEDDQVHNLFYASDELRSIVRRVAFGTQCSL